MLAVPDLPGRGTEPVAAEFAMAALMLSVVYCMAARPPMIPMTEPVIARDQTATKRSTISARKLPDVGLTLVRGLPRPTRFPQMYKNQLYSWHLGRCSGVISPYTYA